MAGLELMVELRRRHGRPAPDTDERGGPQRSSRTARARSSPTCARPSRPSSRADQRKALERAETAPDEPEPLLAGQALLARELPDYWQRFETHRAAYARACLEAPPPPSGWLGRLLGRDQAARKPGSGA